MFANSVFCCFGEGSLQGDVRFGGGRNREVNPVKNKASSMLRSSKCFQSYLDKTSLHCLIGKGISHSQRPVLLLFCFWCYQRLFPKSWSIIKLIVISLTSFTFPGRNHMPFRADSLHAVYSSHTTEGRATLSSILAIKLKSHTQSWLNLKAKRITI